MGTQCGFWWWRALEASPQNRWTCFQHEDVSFSCLCHDKNVKWYTLLRYQLVRETTQMIYQEMIEQEGWINKQEVIIAPLNQYMVKVRQGFLLLTCILYGVALVLSLNFGTLCIWNVSVMGFRRHEWGRGHEFHGSNSRSCRDYYCETHASWLGAQTSP